MIGCDTSNICSEDQKFLANIFGVVGMVIIGCACASIDKKKKKTKKEQKPLLDHTKDPAVATIADTVQPQGEQPYP